METPLNSARHRQNNKGSASVGPFRPRIIQRQSPPEKLIQKKISTDYRKGKMAERGGFEPPIPFKGYTGLANQRLQPLGHLSNIPQKNREFGASGSSRKVEIDPRSL